MGPSRTTPGGLGSEVGTGIVVIGMTTGGRVATVGSFCPDARLKFVGLYGLF